MLTQSQGFQLSPQQKRLWLLQQDNSVYCACCAILITGNLQVSILKDALYKVVDRNEILRTKFSRPQGIKIPSQVIEAGNFLFLEQEINSDTSLPQLIDELFIQERQSRQKEAEYFFTTKLLRISQNQHILFLSIPALCADTVSLNNLVAEISNCYNAYLQDEDILDEPLQYADIATWLNELLEAEEMNAGRRYWRQIDISKCGIYKLIYENPYAQPDNFQPEVFTTSLHQQLVNKINEITQNYQTSTSTFLLTCWLILLWRLTENSDLIIGTGFDGRSYEELKAGLGLFAKYLPLTCHLEDGDRFGDVLVKVNQITAEMSEWQESFSWETSLANQQDVETAFFPFCFEFTEAPKNYTAGEITLSLYQHYVCFDRFKVKLAGVQTVNDELKAEFHYDGNLFALADIENLAHQFTSVLASAIENPQANIAKLNVLSPRERKLLLVDFNNSKTPELPYQCIHHWFEAQCQQTPNNIAVVFEEQKLTYQELNIRANQLAHYLQKLGVGSESLVGICVERSPWMVIGLLAILKAGGAYVPLDPTYPPERQAYIIADAHTPLVLTQQHLAASLPTDRVQLLCIDTEWLAIAQEKTANPLTQTTSENLAYVIYTSGSTGKPKGTLITHRGLVNYLSWCTQAYAVEQGIGTLVHSPLGFDLTVTSLFSPLLVGCQVELLPENQGIEALFTALRRSSNLSLVKITPSHLDLLKGQLSPEEIAGRTRAFIIGGENLLAEKLAFWQDFAPDTMLVNEYGPTETVVGCCIYQVPNNQRDSGSVPIGKAIANTQLYLLDKHWQPVPIGAVGELYIAGFGLARGYLNQPELTAQKFIPNPFSDRPGERLYKTGDLARYRPDGTLEFLGRIDNQVKIRGFRIELGEIEAVLDQYPGVDKVVVIAREDRDREKRLVAYFVVKQQPGPSTTELRSYLLEKLPEYMVPATFVKLDALPLTSNGKVDYRALPEQAQPDLESTYVAPQSDLERMITNIWQELLHVNKVGIHHNFFDIGGHSLLMVQVHSKLQKALNRDISLLDMFQFPTISKLAKHLSQEENKPTLLESHEPDENLRESRKQRRQLRQEHRATNK
jgi:amino acid adenylation domain-containing protein